MKIPNQAAPVYRTATGVIKDNEQPIAVLDFTHASLASKLNLITNLIHGANYNAPMRFAPQFNSSGCHIFSENSMGMCLAAFGMFRY
jgi:hypothetical protein